MTPEEALAPALIAAARREHALREALTEIATTGSGATWFEQHARHVLDALAASEDAELSPNMGASELREGGGPSLRVDPR